MCSVEAALHLIQVADGVFLAQIFGHCHVVCWCICSLLFPKKIFVVLQVNVAQLVLL